ncbi:MAG: VanZ family protein [bacterium]
MIDAVKKWAIAFGYVGVIYLTLPVMRGLLNWIRKISTAQAFSITTNLFMGFVFILLMFYLLRRHFPFSRILIFLLVCSVFLIFIKNLKLPEERVHFLEYGLCGFLFMDAAALKKWAGWRKVAIAVLLAVSAGVIDELLQGILPSRVYDIRDIYFNSVAGIGGVVCRWWLFNQT